jgi:hypothetical protein
MKDDFVLRRNPGRREAAVAVAVACVLLLVSWAISRLGGGIDDSQSPASPPTTSARPDVGTAQSTINIDDGSVTKAQVRACAGSHFAAKHAKVDVLYGVLQQTAIGDSPVIVLRNPAGDIRLCDSFGADRPSTLPIPQATAAAPVAFLSNGRSAWDCDGERIAGFSRTYWLSVAPVVDRVQTRFIVDGVSSPWFSSKAHGGIVHLQAWLGQQDSGVIVQSETKVIDADGQVVAQNAIPSGVRTVDGCHGHDVTVG